MTQFCLSGNVADTVSRGYTKFSQTLRPLNTLNNKIFLCETVFEAPATLNYPGNKEKWKIISESNILVFLLLI